MSYQREFTTRLRVGLVGAGSHAYRTLLPALHYLPVSLRAICDVDETRARATAAEYGDCRAFTSLEAMLGSEPLDAVLLAVSHAHHPALAITALDAGVHVWMEKPVGSRAREVRDVIAHRRDRVVVVGFKKLFMPAARKACEIIQSPNYGHLRTMLAVYPVTMPRDGRAALEAPALNPWLEAGCHPLSLLLRVGGRVARVTTRRANGRAGVCLLEFANGVLATVHLGSGPAIELYRFFGDRWHLSIDDGLRVTLQRGAPRNGGDGPSYCPPGDDHGAIVWEPSQAFSTLENNALVTQGIFDELRYFCDCVLTGRQATLGSLEFALHLMHVYEASLMSDGQPVPVPDVSD